MNIRDFLHRLKLITGQDTLAPGASAISPASNDSAPIAPSLTEHIEESQHIATQLDMLLNNYKSLMEIEGAGEKVKVLKEWAETYCNGLSAAEEIAKNGNAWISDLRDQTKLAADELHRFEDEGGPPATPKQAAKAEELMKVARKLDKVAPHIEHQFGGSCESQDAEIQIPQENAA